MPEISEDEQKRIIRLEHVGHELVRAIRDKKISELEPMADALEKQLRSAQRGEYCTHEFVRFGKHKQVCKKCGFRGDTGDFVGRSQDEFMRMREVIGVNEE